MSKFLSALYKALCHFSIAFSGIILFLWCFMHGGQYIDYERIQSFLIFALVFGATSFIFALPKIHEVFKIVLHFLFNTVAFIFTFLNSDGMNMTKVFVAVFFFVVLYFAVLVLSRVLKALCRKKAEKAENEE